MPLPSTTAGTRASELGAPIPQPRSPRDCKQICLALVVSRKGMPIGDEVFAGNPERGEVRSPQMRPPIGRARARRLDVGGPPRRFSHWVMMERHRTSRADVCPTLDVSSGYCRTVSHQLESLAVQSWPWTHRDPMIRHPEWMRIIANGGVQRGSHRTVQCILGRSRRQIRALCQRTCGRSCRLRAA
jgi:hypothetical protein